MSTPQAKFLLGHSLESLSRKPKQKAHASAQVRARPEGCLYVFALGCNKPKGKFQFFSPHHLSVQKVQTSLITLNSGQVSPPLPSRIMIAQNGKWPSKVPTTSPKCWAKTINQPLSDSKRTTNNLENILSTASA